MVRCSASNGSGKSTTLKAISGTVKPVSGQIEYQGESTAGKSPNSMVQLGWRMCPKAVAFSRICRAGESSHGRLYAQRH
jgi:branched-chain amino acid transport system ATP-binding protein